MATKTKQTFTKDPDRKDKTSSGVSTVYRSTSTGNVVRTTGAAPVGGAAPSPALVYPSAPATGPYDTLIKAAPGGGGGGGGKGNAPAPEQPYSPAPATQQNFVLPDPTPPTQQLIYREGVDPSRTDTGLRLWTTPRGEQVNIGDILPSIQEITRPITHPIQTYEERGGDPSEFLGNVAKESAFGAIPFGNVARAMITKAGPAEIGGAAIPRAALEGFNLLSQLTERHVGDISQRYGTGGAVANQRVPMRLWPEARRALRDEAGQGTFLGIGRDEIANAIASTEAEGGDASALREVLTEAVGEEEALQTIQDQRDLMTFREDYSPEVRWQASQFTYEGVSHVLEAARRMANGEDPATVAAEITDDLTFKEIAADLAASMVLDPLNILDYVKVRVPFTNIEFGGGALGRMQNFAEEARNIRVVRSADPDAVLDAFHTIQDIRPQNIIQRIGRFFQPTDETKLLRIGGEVSDVLYNLAGSMSREAPENLAELGITAHPNSVFMDLFMNPQAEDLMNGVSAERIAEALGFKGADLAAQYNVAPDVMDLFNNEAAIRTRDVLSNMADEGQSLLPRWREVEQKWADALSMTQRGRARDAAITEAEDAFIEYLNHMDGAIRRAVGMPETEGVSFIRKTKRQMDKLQNVFATYFHMGPSPGWAIRNYGNNFVTGLFDGVDMITPLRRVEDNLSRYGIANSSLGRGGTIGRIGNATEGLPFAERLIGTVLGRRWERGAGLRGNWSGFSRTMQDEWRVGRQISQEAYDIFEHEIGDPALARGLRNVIENAWTTDDLDDIARAIEAEPWRILDDDRIARGLRRIDLYDDVDEILRGADSIDDLAARLDDYVGQFNQIADDAIGTMPPRRGTAGARLSAEEQAVLDMAGADADEQRLILQDTQRRIEGMRQAANDAKNWARQHLEALSGARQRGELTTEQLSELDAVNELFRQADEQADLLYGTNHDQIEEMLDGLWKRRGPIWFDQDVFRDIAQRYGTGREGLTAAFDKYRQLTKSWWVESRLAVFEDFSETGRRAAALLGDELRPAPNWDEIMVRLGIGYEDWDIFNGVQNVARNNGISNIWHLTNYLKQEGLLAADVPVFQPEHITTENYLDIVNAIRSHGPAAWGAGDVPDETLSRIDDIMSAAGDVFRAEGDGNPYDFASVRRATANEVETLLGQVLRNAQDKADEAPVLLTEAQREALSQFTQGLRPQLIGVRGVAESVGNEVRDFQLLTYQKSNFDTLLGMVYAYPYWYTRTIGNFVRRAIDQPGQVAALFKLRQGLRRINNDLPEWWQDQITFKTATGQMAFPILNMLDPLNGFVGDKYWNEDQRSTLLGAFVSNIGNYGPSTHAWIQIMMATLAAAKGDKREQLAWMSYLGQWTRGVNAITTIGREMGLNFIPEGGIGVEPWMYTMTSEGLKFIGDNYDADRIGKAMADLYENGEIEGANPIVRGLEALFYQDGPLFGQALQRAHYQRAGRALLSWLAGTALAVRPESEIEIAEFDMARRALWERRPGSGHPEEMTREEQRLAYRQLDEQYPWGDFVIMSRRDGEQRDEEMVWSVYNRLPPNNSDYLEAVDIDPETLSRWYDGGFDAMTDLEQEDFMNKILQLNAMLALPDDATSSEWFEAKEAYYGYKDVLAREFGDGQGELDYINDLAETWRHTVSTEGWEAGQEFLTDHAILESYWDRKDELISQDPLLSKYYASMDMFERIAWDNFFDEAEEKYPNLDIDAFWDDYWSLIEAGLYDNAYAMFDEYPEMDQYLRDKNLFVLGLDDQLNEMVAPIASLEPHWATLREDAEAAVEESPDSVSPQQLSIYELIKSGSRPMGDWELPEDLDARQVEAAIDLEKASLLDGAMWGVMYDELEQMGGLDDTLRAFNEWDDVDTLNAHLPELQALAVAMEQIRTEQGWDYAGDESFDPAIGATTGTGAGAASTTGGGYGTASAEDDEERPYTLTNYAAAAPTTEAYTDILTSERWVTNEVEDVADYLEAAIEAGSWQVPDIMSLSADTREMAANFLNGVAGQEVDPAAVQQYLETAIIQNDAAAGLEFLAPGLQEAGYAFGTALLTEYAERLADAMGVETDGGGGGGGGGGYRYTPRQSYYQRPFYSYNYGGVSQESDSVAKRSKKQEKISNFLTALKRRAPRYWGKLRNLADMSKEEAKEYLADPDNADFARYLKKYVWPEFGKDMKALLKYFRQGQKSGYARTQQRQSYSGDPGTYQRWRVPY